MPFFITKEGKDKAKAWNEYSAAYMDHYEDLVELRKCLKAEEAQGTLNVGVSVETIRWTRKADGSMRKLEKAWKRYKETVI